MVQEVEYHLYWIDQLFDENCLSDFDKWFQDLALLEPNATFMSYPFREDVEVDALASNGTVSPEHVCSGG
jgi:hypothetical protein